MKLQSYLLIFLVGALISLGIYSYSYKVAPLPDEIKSHLLTSLVKKEIILSLPNRHGTPTSPSISTRKEGGYLLAAIVQKKEHYQTKKWKSKERPTKYSIAVTKLSETLHPSGSYQFIEPKEESGVPLFNLNEIHLASYNGETWAFYSDEVSPEKLNLYAAPLYEHEGKWILGHAKLLSSSSAKWSPLAIDNELYLLSSTNPISCVKMDLASSEYERLSPMQIDQIWPFGQIQHRAPMIKTDLGIIGFFHSIFRTQTWPIHFFGAWSATLEDNAFALKSILHQPIGSKKLYSLLSNKKKRIEPTGVTEKNGYLVVSSLIGKNKISLIQIKTADLFEHLHPIPDHEA